MLCIWHLMKNLEACAGFIKNCNAEAKMLREIKSKIMADRANALENTVARVNHYVKIEMELTEMKTRKVGSHKLTVVQNPLRLHVVDEGLLPSAYKEWEVKIDKRRLNKEFKETGEVIEGCDVVEGSHLRLS